MLDLVVLFTEHFPSTVYNLLNSINPNNSNKTIDYFVYWQRMNKKYCHTTLQEKRKRRKKNAVCVLSVYMRARLPDSTHTDR